MTIAHLLISATQKQSVVETKQSKAEVVYSVGLRFVSPDPQAEEAWSKLAEKIHENLEDKGITEVIMEHERWLVARGFIPCGLKSDERTYYLPKK